MNDWKSLSAVKLFVVIIFFTLAGCTATSPVATPSGEAVSSVSTIVATPALPTQTPLPATPTPSTTPTLTPTPSSPPTSAPTVTPTATETPYAIPTPLGTEVTEQVLWLMETNNGCQLPCWWGIIPGQTEWQAAEKLLVLFDAHIYTVSASGFDYYNPSIPLPVGLFSVNQVSPIYAVQNGIVQKIETLVPIGDTASAYFAQYVLPTFLTTYGQPREIWLSTYRSAFEEGDLPFFTVLFYPDQGIMAVYEDNGERRGDLVEGCPQEDIVSYLVLQVPGLDKTFEETITRTSGLGEWDYLLLEEATEIDVATFYETFQNPDNTTCLQTPANLWR